MAVAVYFASLISRENRPIHVQEIQPPKSLKEIVQEQVNNEQRILTPNPSGCTSDDILKYHFLSNMALDVFLSPFYEGETGIEQLLFTQDGINIYGLETNTGLKILVGTPDKLDASFRVIFQKLHKIYLGLVLNPFQNNDNLTNLTINEKKLGDKIIKLFQ